MQTAEKQLQESVLSAHPVSDAMRATVLAQLKAVEQAHDVTVLFACESGSRGWGFASPDSDYDVRFVYVPRLPWYLRTRAGRDVIELPVSAELDVSGWELRKALQLMQASNPVLLEWLRSPVVYCSVAAWVPRLRELALQSFSPVRGYHHYLSMARKTMKNHLRPDSDVVKYKKYFYALRPLLAARWIREIGTEPPMRFAELATALLHDADLLAELNALLAIKMRAGEAATSAPWPRIQAFLQAELALAEQYAPSARSLSAELVQAADAFLLDAVAHFNTQ
ncbi:MAG: nucleotidyltransferase domain-containing protein [Comamonas sp.]|jgi:predicted nucleotidyltransferase|uniref:nucleotidyltransferase domain-containing protein n=1 Tax=Comamonas sp. TaxID=34028 RepID=UPI00282ABB5F|nr:nucleotidyltransferase domain-containing protein [Comamonas sp.]MDR0212418.1 nucleotidyltransferase domain-containing protein [Comamonas sp.]